jgi:putative ABC transport system permease protein
LISGRFAENDSELVISNHINTNGGASYKIGDIITLKYGERVVEGINTLANNEYYEEETLNIVGEKTYTIVGIVERSNFEDYSASGYSTFTLDMNDKDGIVNVFVMFNNKKKIIKQSEDLAKKLGYDNAISYNSTLLALYGESTYGNVMSSMGGMMIIMLSFLIIPALV